MMKHQGWTVIWGAVIFCIGIQANATSKPSPRKHSQKNANISLSGSIAFDVLETEPRAVLQFHGAEGNQIKNAPCKTLRAPTRTEIEQFIDQKWGSGGIQIEKEINGVVLKNESNDLLTAFYHLTSALKPFRKHVYDPATKRYTQVDDIDLDRQKNFQELFVINPACTSVKCAVKKIWGDDLGLKILYLRLRFGFNASEYATANSDRFKIDEINDVLMAVMDLPESYIPFSPNKQLTHFKRGYTLAMYEDDLVLANATISLFDLWDHEKTWDRQYAVFHEIAHNISTRYGRLDQSAEWIKLSSECEVSIYGKSNAAEDFAESISTFRYRPEHLKQICPAKFEWIQNMLFRNAVFACGSSSS